MNLKAHKIITAIMVSLMVWGSLVCLLLLANLNDLALYLKTALWVWLIMCGMFILFYDLHFKVRGSWEVARMRHINVEQKFERFIKTASHAFWLRFEHMRSWQTVYLWLNYLLLPGFIFWATIALFYLDFGFYKLQIIILILSSIALSANHWYLKEIFFKKQERLDRGLFIRMTMIKIYASAICFGTALAITRRFCLEWQYLAAGVFLLTMLLLYQSLFQHRMIVWENLFWSALISLAMAIISYNILLFWGYNYYTAAVFMTVCYNLMWGVFHYHLDKSLTMEAFWELIIISFLLGYMVFSVTNFKAQILDSCRY